MRPWDSPPGPYHGPAPPADRDGACGLLQQLGARFKQHGLTDARSKVQTTNSDECATIIRELGARGFGDFPPPPPLSKPNSRDDDSAVVSELARAFCPGDLVILQNLAKVELNGQEARVLKRTAAVKPDRVPVKIVSTGQGLSVLPENLRKQELCEQSAGSPPAANESEGNSGLLEKATASDLTSLPDVKTQLPAPVAAYSEEKMTAGLAADKATTAQLWQAFLAGDDKPVGGVMIPPPEAFSSA